MYGKVQRLLRAGEDDFVGQGKVWWCQRNVVLWPSKGKGGFGLVGGGGILFEGIRRRISLYGRNIFEQFANLRLTDFTNIIAYLKYANQ